MCIYIYSYTYISIIYIIIISCCIIPYSLYAYMPSSSQPNELILHGTQTRASPCLSEIKTFSSFRSRWMMFRLCLVLSWRRLSCPDVGVFSPLGIYWAHIALLFTCWYIYTLYSHWVLKYVVWRYQAIVWQNLSLECLQAGKALSHRVKKWLSKHVKTWYVCCGHPSRSGIILIMGTNYIHLCASINGLMAIPQYIQSNFGLGSRMNSEVHNDTAPDSGGGVSAFELGQQSERPKSWYTKRTCIMHNFGPCMAYMIPSRNSACRQIGPIMTHPIQTITHLKNRIPSFDV